MSDVSEQPRIHICQPRNLLRWCEHSRESMGVKWCFKCRGRHEFSWIVMAAEIEYDEDGSISALMYSADPYAHSECSNCKQHAGELFPGWSYSDV